MAGFSSSLSESKVEFRFAAKEGGVTGGEGIATNGRSRNTLDDTCDSNPRSPPVLSVSLDFGSWGKTNLRINVRYSCDPSTLPMGMSDPLWKRMDTVLSRGVSMTCHKTDGKYAPIVQSQVDSHPGSDDLIVW